MDLREWLFFERRTVKEFAELLDYSRPHITGIISGKYNPSRKLVKRIEKATAGQVTAEDFEKNKKNTMIEKVKSCEISGEINV